MISAPFTKQILNASIGLLLILMTIVGANAQRLDLSQISSFEEFRYEIFEISPDGTWYIYLATGELMTSIDEGVNWQLVSLPFPNDENLQSIRFFSDGAPFIDTESNYYTWINGEWIQLADFEANQNTINTNGKSSYVRAMTIYNDTIWYAQDSIIYLSTDRGFNSTELFESDSLKHVLTIHISDKHLYLLGRDNASYYSTNKFYEKYTREYNIVEKVVPVYYYSSDWATYFGKIAVTPKDSIGFTNVYDASSADGGYIERIFSFETLIKSHDFKVNGDKAYFTYDGHDFGVYDFISGQLATYDINQQGQIHFYKEKIYISDRNKILDVTEYESGQVKTIIPDLKRNFTDAKEYKISSKGVVYAYTGYNLFAYSGIDSQWFQLDLGYDELINFDLSPGGSMYALSNKHLFVSDDGGQSIVTKAHNSFLMYWSQNHSNAILSVMRVFDDNTIYLIGSIPGTFAGSIFALSFDKGDTYDIYEFSIPWQSITQLGSKGVFTGSNSLGDFVQGSFVPLWDTQHPDIVALPFGYNLVPIDSSLIYLHPSRFNSGYNLYTTDLGQTWTKSTFGPFGNFYRGSGYESSWVVENRVFLRDSLEEPYNEIDFSSLGTVKNVLAAPDGATYFDHEGELYKLEDLIYHQQRISGRLYLDADNDCFLDQGEQFESQNWTFTLTGPNYSLTTISTDGRYDFDVPIGDFQLQVFPPSSLWTLCDNTYDISVTVPLQDIEQDIAVSADEQCVRLEVGLSTPKVKRCRITSYALSVQNTGTAPSEEVFVDITPDPFYEFLPYENNVPFEIQSNGDIRFNFGSLGVMESKKRYISFNVSCLSSLGQQHCMFAEAYSADLCANATSELVTEYQNNVGPFDPNDLRVFNSLGYRALNFRAEDRQFYHVRFQNTGTDTAENVEVRVQLDDSLDIRTLHVLDSSHDFEFTLNDAHDLILRFDNIMLPDSFVNEPGSNGYFRYSLKPLRDVSEGQEFNSSAAIYFDYNQPVITNTATSMIGRLCGPPKVEDITVFKCYGENYDEYTRSGYYEDYLTSADGCDSIRKLNLTVQSTFSQWLDNIVLCGDESYNGISSDTLVRTTLQNYYGCDSTIIQRIYSSEWIADRELVLTGCVGDTLSGYYETGIYIDTIRTTRNCYVKIINLTITEVEYVSEIHELCHGEQLDTIYESGIYMDTIRNYDLCDSLIIEREIIVLDEIISSVYIEGCEGDIIEGYETSGIYTDVLTARSGCDSTRTLELDLYDISESIEIMEICRGQEYHGYNHSGTYIDTLISLQGCDSIRTLNLEVYELAEEFMALEICSGESYEGYSTSGIFSDTFIALNGCDSTRVVELTVLPPSIELDTIYLCPWESYEGVKAPGMVENLSTNSLGCDSIRQVDLVLVQRSDPTCAFTYDFEPKLMSDTEFLNITPNPIIDVFTMEVIRTNQLPSTLKLLNAQHQLVKVYEITDHTTAIDISELATGLYIVVLESKNNSYVDRIIKL